MAQKKVEEEIEPIKKRLSPVEQEIKALVVKAVKAGYVAGLLEFQKKYSKEIQKVREENSKLKELWE